MLDCLIDYIGVDGCSSEVPDSGRYINELPGVSLKMIAGIADDDQETFNGVWDVVQKRAIRKFSRDVRVELAKRYQLRSITTNQDVSRIINESSLVSASSQYRGIIIETREKNSDFSCSNMQSFYLQKVRFYATSQNDITVAIFDLDRGVKIKEVTLDSTDVVSDNWNDVKILDSFEAARIYIAVDCTNFDTVHLDITKNRSAAWYNTCYLDMNGATNDLSSSVDSPTEGSNTFGVSPVFSIKCSFDKLICDNLKVFEQAFMLCLGIELMDERIFSDRLSEFTQFDTEQARENRQLFVTQYRGGEIDEMTEDGELKAVLDGLNFNINDICLECNHQVNYINDLGV